jgi:hypothetical protein
MSKLVYKSINEIINKKFLRNEDLADVAKGTVGADPTDQQGRIDDKNDSLKSRYKIKQKALMQDKDKILKNEIRDNQIAMRQANKQENFDAQTVPGMPPVGMPPMAAPAPAPIPKPAGAPNYEGGHMTKTQLCQAHEACSNLMASIEDYDSLPDWLKGKITLAADYLVKCESFVNAKDQEHEDSQDEHMPKGPESGMPGPSPMKPPMGGSPLMGISLGRVQSVSPGE